MRIPATIACLLFALPASGAEVYVTNPVELVQWTQKMQGERAEVFQEKGTYKNCGVLFTFIPNGVQRLLLIGFGYLNEGGIVVKLVNAGTHQLRVRELSENKPPFAVGYGPKQDNPDHFIVGLPPRDFLAAKECLGLKPVEQTTQM
jgi:hypothetical protein